MKKFNTTGVCIPEKHYMADVSKKIKEIKRMVESGKYFTINKPRQSGKTTILYLLEKKILQDNFIPILISFEGIGDEVFNSEKAFIKAFINLMKKDLSFKNEHNKLYFDQRKIDNLDNFADLNNYLFELVNKAERKIVLMIDEVDKSSNNQLFLSFLGLLRDKFTLALHKNI